MGDRFYTKRLRHNSGTIQVIDTEGFHKTALLPELFAQCVCDALNIADRPQITPERLREFAEFVAPDSAFLPSAGRDRDVYQTGFDHALLILRERFELGEAE